MSTTATIPKRNSSTSLLTIGVMFFVFGFVTWLNSILIPYFKIACELNNLQSYLVAFAFYIAYLVMSLPAAYLLEKTGFKKGMMIGFFVMAAGAMLFVPAALSRTYLIFLAGLFTLGTGLAILQTAANPYVTLLGPIESAARRISIMGICNKAAGVMAPLLFAAVVLKVTDNDLFRQLPLMSAGAKNIALDELIRRVVLPYAILSLILFCLGIFVRFSKLPEIEAEQDEAEIKAGKNSILQFPHLILGAIAIFLHVGSQVIAVDTVINYAGSMGITLPEAKVFPSYILFATICGYLIGIVTIPKLISQVNALRTCTVLGLTFSFCLIFMHGSVSVFGHHTDLSIWFLVALGLPNSLIWAGIWPLALSGLGRYTKKGSSFLIMGLCGNAILPLCYGYLADRFTLKTGYWVLVPCYFYLVFFAAYGHKIRRGQIFSRLSTLK
ncbi:sugar MFS transporter [Mucilaginibacter sp.]|uniref:sugar MFS transporter n=1 Tax=Mucilaginibacter sp. TaxID=1882438 RepID=UPI003B006845